MKRYNNKAPAEVRTALAKLKNGETTTLFVEPEIAWGTSWNVLERCRQNREAFQHAAQIVRQEMSKLGINLMPEMDRDFRIASVGTNEQFKELSANPQVKKFHLRAMDYHPAK
ncbi:MAG TPA: hypothetical protein PKI93_06005 [Alphaproteobacteria bacterium]|nr:hypothetical protein [Alphaproteobacteria bacterium]HNS43692.1 hypothetical protein [Alphaproteobacteria bacterium]